MAIYYAAMTFAALFLLSAGWEVVSVLAKGPSWRAVFTTAGLLFFALVSFLVGMANY